MRLSLWCRSDWSSQQTSPPLWRTRTRCGPPSGGTASSPPAWEPHVGRVQCSAGLYLFLMTIFDPSAQSAPLCRASPRLIQSQWSPVAKLRGPRNLLFALPCFLPRWRFWRDLPFRLLRVFLFFVCKNLLAFRFLFDICCVLNIFIILLIELLWIPTALSLRWYIYLLFILWIWLYSFHKYKYIH